MKTDTKNWQKTKVRDLLSSYIGGGWGSDSKTTEFSEPAFVIRGTDIPDVSIGDTGSLPFRYHKKSNIKSRRLSNGDIVFEVSGGSKGQWVGRSLIIKNELLKQLPDDVMPASFCKGLTPDAEKVDSVFFYYFLQKIYQSDEISQWQTQSTGISNFKFEKFLDECFINLPSKLTQEQISCTLSTYDDLIENNTKRIKILEEIAQAIYKEWLVPSASKKWKIATLRDVIESYTGGGWGKEEFDKDYSGLAYVIRGTDIPHASVGNISTCPLRYHKLSNLRARVLQDGDLMFEVSGGSKGQPVGRSLLVTTKLLDQFKQNVICASFCKLIRPDKNKISPFQMYEQILNWYENGVIEKYQVQSTGISNFRFESFIDEEKIILPPEEIRKKFDKLILPLFDEIYSLGSQNQKLRQARDLLLPKLVTGEVEVR